jgi:hypothetical protein
VAALSLKREKGRATGPCVTEKTRLSYAAIRNSLSEWSFCLSECHWARGPPSWEEDDSGTIILDEERFVANPLVQPEPEYELDQRLSW